MFRAVLLAALRDFERAHHHARQALEIAPDRPWMHVEYCQILELEDRVEEALGAAQQALELQPWYRPAVQAVGHVYRISGRNEECLEFLRAASEHL